jgi:LPXTG-motif cell wall-anchored protein
MRRLAMMLGAIFALAMVGATSAATTLTVPLATLNGSGVSGTATLTDMGTQTQVVITVTGEATSASEPDHIHTGQCGATLGGVKFPLKNVEGGTSTTVVNVALSALQNGSYAINLHESAANIGNYVACGNIPALATTSLPATGGVPSLAVVLVAGGLLGAGYVLRRRSGKAS